MATDVTVVAWSNMPDYARPKNLATRQVLLDLAKRREVTFQRVTYTNTGEGLPKRYYEAIFHGEGATRPYGQAHSTEIQYLLQVDGTGIVDRRTMVPVYRDLAARLADDITRAAIDSMVATDSVSGPVVTSDMLQGLVHLLYELTAQHDELASTTRRLPNLPEREAMLTALEQFSAQLDAIIDKTEAVVKSEPQEGEPR